jgi:hypothetical protein
MNYQLAPNRKRFDVFTRAGMTYTPLWIYRQVGDVSYDISLDAFVVVLKAHWDLTVTAEPAQGMPDGGRTPLQSGYEPVAAVQLPPYRCQIPQWVAEVGIEPRRFARAMAELAADGVTHGG